MSLLRNRNLYYRIYVPFVFSSLSLDMTGINSECDNTDLYNFFPSTVTAWPLPPSSGSTVNNSLTNCKWCADLNLFLRETMILSTMTHREKHNVHRHRNHGGSGGWCPPLFSGVVMPWTTYLDPFLQSPPLAQSCSYAYVTVSGKTRHIASSMKF
jgi:hypothetical protein